MADLERQLSAGSKSSLHSSLSVLSNEDIDDVQFPTSKPLPPISKGGTPDDTALSQKSGSPKRSRPGSKRREESFPPLSAGSRRTVSFIDGENLLKENKVDSCTIHGSVTRKTYDGREIVMVTVDVQTEMSMLRDESLPPSAKSSRNSPASQRGSPSPHNSVHSLKMDAEESESEGEFSEVDVNSEPGEEDRKSPKSPKHKSQTPVLPSRSKDKMFFEGVKIYPEMSFSDEYGIPMPDLDTDSDLSDIDDDAKPVNNRELDDVKEEDEGLPSIGPPQILKYKRESDEKELEISGQSNDETDGPNVPIQPMANGKCEFCSENVLPFPTYEQQVKQQPDELYCCQKYREFVDFTLKQSEPKDDADKDKIDIVPHAPFGSKAARKAAKERAQARMDSFKLMKKSKDMKRRRPPSSRGSNNSLVSDVLSPEPSTTPNMSSKTMSTRPTTGTPDSGAGRARDREQDKIRQSQLQQQQRTTAAASQHQDHGGGGGGGGGNFYSSSASRFGDISRQMKTINFSLASVRCLDEGWTHRAPSPIEKDLGPNVFESEALVYEPSDFDLSNDQSRRQRFDSGVVVKYYPEGNKFLTMFKNGSGNVFYPSGNVAIIIIRVEKGQYEYIIQEDSNTQPKVLAVFQPNGKACCYYNSGLLRMCLDEYGGVEHDAHGARRRKWNWRDVESDPMQTSPFQPLCLALNPIISIRVMTQDNIALTFRTQTRSCRFTVGAKLKMVARNLIPPLEIEMDSIYMSAAKVKVETLLNKISNLLKFPKSPKVDAIKPPQHVTLLAERTEKLRREQTLQKEKKNQPQTVRVN